MSLVSYPGGGSSQQGPEGPQGPPGANGSAGAAGPGALPPFTCSAFGTTGTRYPYPGGAGNTANGSIQPVDVPAACTTVRMRVRASAAGFGVGTYTITLCTVVAGVAIPTALTVVMNATAQSAVVAASVMLADGDTIAVQVVVTGVVASSPTNPVITISVV